MLTPKYLRALLPALLIASIASHANAGTVTWTGGAGNGNFSNGSNWSGGTPAGTYGELLFQGSTQTTGTDDISSTVNQSELLWTGGSSWTLNAANGGSLSLFDNGGTQAKIENQSTGSVTLNVPITFAATSGAAWAEINAVSGNITFSSAGAVTVNGSILSGLRFFGSNHVTTFNDTVSASGKYMALTGGTTTIVIGGTFTSGDVYVMNGGLVSVSGSLSTSAIRLGGDFGTTGFQNLALGGTFALTNATGGQTFAGTINSVTGNTSGALVVNATNTSGADTLAGNIFLDSSLIIRNTAGGTLNINSGTTFDVRANTLTFNNAGTISVGTPITSSSNSGNVIVNGGGKLTLNGTGNYTNGTTVSSGTVVLGITNALPSTSGALRIGGAGAAVDLNGHNQTVTGFNDNGGLTTGVLTNSSATSGTFTLNDTGLDSYAGAITDGGSGNQLALVKMGTGTFAISGSNAYHGGTTISAGVLNIQNANGLGAASSGVTVSSGATLQLQGGIITTANALSLNGIGAANGALDSLSGVNTYSGSLTLAAASTISSDASANALTLNGGIANSGSRITFTGAGDVTLSNNGINGTGGDILKQGAGNLNLNVASNFTNVFIDQGTVNAGVASALGTTNGTTTGAVTMGSSVTGGLNTVLNISGTNITVANPITVRYLETGGKAITSTALTGTNTYSGPISLSDHVTLDSSTGATLLFTGVISQAAGTLSATPGAGNIVNTSPTGGFSTTGPGVIINGATGSGVSGVVEYDTAMTYTGDTVVNTGTLQFNGAGSLANSSIRLGNSGAATLNLISPTGSTLNVTVNVRPSTGTKVISASNTSGTSTLGGHFALDDNATVLEASPTGTLAITQVRNGADTVSATDIKGFTLTLTPAGTINYAGTIYNSTGNGNVIMNGTGMLILSGSNTYSGTTTVASGNLAVTNANGSATGASAVNITPNASGLATLSGNGTISGGAVVTSATSATVGVTHIAPGVNVSGANNNFGNAGTLHIGNGLTIGNGTNLDFDLGSTSDLLAVAGTLNLGSNVVLNVTQAGGFAAGTVYTLINGGYSIGGAGTAPLSTWTASGGPGGSTAVFSGAGGVITVDFVSATTYNLTAGTSISRMIAGTTTASSVITGAITNAGATGKDTLTYGGLGVTASAGTVNNATTTGGPLATGASGTNTGQTFTAPGTAQTVTLTPVGSGTNGTLGGAATLGTTTTASITVVNNRTITASPVNLGDVLVGNTTGAQTSTLSSPGSHSQNTDLTVASGTNTQTVTGTSIIVGSASAQTFNGTTTTGALGISGSFATSGAKSSSVNVTTTGEALAGETDAPVNVAYTANVFQAAALTPSSTAGSLSLSNAASTDGGQRAGVTITGFTTTNSNFIVTTANSGTVGVANGSPVTSTVGTVTTASSDLSGTYSYTGNVTGSAQYTDAALQGTAITSPVWNGVMISGTVTGATSSGTAQVKSAFVANTTSYTGYGLTSAVPLGFGHGTTPTVATLLAGTAGGDTTVNMNFSSNGGHPVNAFQASDTLTLSGIHATGSANNGPDGSTLTDIFVLQISYVPVNGTNASYYIGWWDATKGLWVNAIAGNSNSNLPNDYIGSGAFAGTYTAYTTTGPGTGQPLSAQLGAYGFDSTTDTAWAVLDHNSDFEVIPEPSTYAMIFSGFGMLIGFQRFRRKNSSRK